MTTKIQTIKALVGLMAEAGLSSMEIREDNFYIKLEKNSAIVYPQAIPFTPVAAVSSAPVQEDAPGMNFNDMKTVKSPMVGVFYASPAPERPPFVQIGSRVQEGDVLCIVEAMKLMNEITAECSGEIVDICAANGDVVEFGQTLFKIV